MQEEKMMTDEQRKLAEENIKLVNTYIAMHKIPIDEWDLYYIRYCLGIMNYNPNNEKKVKLSTYIFRALESEKYRWNKKDFLYVSMEDRKDKGALEVDTYDPINEYHSVEDLMNIINKIRSRTKEQTLKKRLIFLLYLNGYTLEQIGSVFGTTKQNISLAILSIKKHYRE